MSVTINGRAWSISDFQDFQHARPKSPDAAGTPAFPDGIFNDMLAAIATVAAAAAQLQSVSALVAALASQTPTLSSATYNAVLTPNRQGTGYVLQQWSVVTSAGASTLNVGSHRVFFDTSAGPFRVVLQGTPSEFDIIEIADRSRTFGMNNLDFVFNGSIHGSVYAGAGATVTFDVSGDHAIYQFINGAWREL